MNAEIFAALAQLEKERADRGAAAPETEAQE